MSPGTGTITPAEGANGESGEFQKGANMKKLAWLGAKVIISLFIWTFCIQVSQADAGEKAKIPGGIVASERNWDAVISEAKKEGAVVLYNTAWSAQLRIDLTNAFKKKYGINLEFSPFTRGSELLAKVQTEQRAGMYLADIFGSGGGTLFPMKAAGLLEPMEPFLLLSEVTEGKIWRNDKVPFLDKDKTIIGMIAIVERQIVYNTNLIKKGEITSYHDLLNPKYKGKITMNDPTFSGAGKEVFVHLALNLWNPEQTKIYLKQLLTQQDAVIERDNRQHVEAVARGKYAIGLGPDTGALASFLKIGAPLDVVILKDGVEIIYGAGCIGIPKKLAHPYATLLFVNWLLSKEGQTIVSNGFSSPSLRNDISITHFNPVFIPQPGEKIFLSNEASMLFADDFIKVVKPIVDEVYKK